MHLCAFGRVSLHFLIETSGQVFFKAPLFGRRQQQTVPSHPPTQPTTCDWNYITWCHLPNWPHQAAVCGYLKEKCYFRPLRYRKLGWQSLKVKSNTAKKCLISVLFTVKLANFWIESSFSSHSRLTSKRIIKFANFLQNYMAANNNLWNDETALVSTDQPRNHKMADFTSQESLIWAHTFLYTTCFCMCTKVRFILNPSSSVFVLVFTLIFGFGLWQQMFKPSLWIWSSKQNLIALAD